MDQGSGDIAEAVNRLVDDYRLRCLWYLREDYYPTTDEERRRVLDAIERHGDVAAHREVVALLPPAEVRRCVLAADGTLFTGDAAGLRLASVEDALVFHPGRIRGALPQPKIAG